MDTVSAACSHMANASYRIGRQASPQAIQETIRGSRELADAFERCREHLQSNGVDLAAAQAVAGPWVTLDPVQERFVGELADQANDGLAACLPRAVRGAGGVLRKLRAPSKSRQSGIGSFLPTGWPSQFTSPVTGS